MGARERATLCQQKCFTDTKKAFVCFEETTYATGETPTAFLTKEVLHRDSAWLPLNTITRQNILWDLVIRWHCAHVALPA